MFKSKKNNFAVIEGQLEIRGTLLATGAERWLD